MSMNEPMQVPALQIDFSNSQVNVVDAPDGQKRLVVVHPCGIAAVIPFPEDAAKQIGAALMGSGRIALASSLPPGPPS